MSFYECVHPMSSLPLIAIMYFLCSTTWQFDE